MYLNWQNKTRSPAVIATNSWLLLGIITALHECTENKALALTQALTRFLYMKIFLIMYYAKEYL